MGRWLNTYTYRIGLEWWFFALAGAFAVAVALCTVSYEALQAATANPAKVLRSE